LSKSPSPEGVSESKADGRGSLTSLGCREASKRAGQNAQAESSVRPGLRCGSLALEVGSQGALIQPGCFRGNLHTSASRCAHSARVKPWTSERGLGPDREPQGECSGREIAARRGNGQTPCLQYLTGDAGIGLRSPVQVGKATGGHCPGPT